MLTALARELGGHARASAGCFQHWLTELFIGAKAALEVDQIESDLPVASRVCQSFPVLLRGAGDLAI